MVFSYNSSIITPALHQPISRARSLINRANDIGQSYLLDVILQLLADVLTERKVLSINELDNSLTEPKVPYINELADPMTEHNTPSISKGADLLSWTI